MRNNKYNSLGFKVYVNYKPKEENKSDNEIYKLSLKNKL